MTYPGEIADTVLEADPAAAAGQPAIQLPCLLIHHT